MKLTNETQHYKVGIARQITGGVFGGDSKRSHGGAQWPTLLRPSSPAFANDVTAGILCGSRLSSHTRRPNPDQSDLRKSAIVRTLRGGHQILRHAGGGRAGEA